MAELKTKATEASVAAFLEAVEDEAQRNDCYAVLEMMREATGEEPKMWGEAMVGFGTYHYKYASGHEGDSLMVGFSPRKQNLTLYLMPGLEGREALLQTLGKHKAGKACLYIKRLEDIDQKVLRTLIRDSLTDLKKWLQATQSPA